MAVEAALLESLAHQRKGAQLETFPDQIMPVGQ